MGFSAVIFALKVVLSHDSPGYSSVMGFQLPTKVCGVDPEGLVGPSVCGWGAVGGCWAYVGVAVLH